MTDDAPTDGSVDAEEGASQAPEHQTWCWISALAWIICRHRRSADELMAAQPAGYGALASALAHEGICDRKRKSDAEKELISALPKLSSRGVPEGALSDIDVPPSDWPLMEPWKSSLGSIGARTRPGVRPYKAYDTILFSAADVMRLWPAAGEHHQQQRRGRRPSLACERFIALTVEALEEKGDVADGPRGWQTDADIIAYVTLQLEGEGHECSESSAKKWVKVGLARFRESEANKSTA